MTRPLHTRGDDGSRNSIQCPNPTEETLSLLVLCVLLFGRTGWGSPGGLAGLDRRWLQEKGDLARPSGVRSQSCSPGIWTPHQPHSPGLCHPSCLLEGRAQPCRGRSPWSGGQKGDAFLEATPLSPWSPQGLFPASQVSQKCLKGLVQEAESREERGPASSTPPCSSRSPALENRKHQCWDI